MRKSNNKLPKETKKRWIKEWGSQVLGIGAFATLLGGLLGYAYLSNEEEKALNCPINCSCRVVQQQLGEEFYTDDGLLKLAVKKFLDNSCVWYVKGMSNLSESSKLITSPYAQRSFLEEAVSNFEKSLEIQESYGARFNLGKSLAKLGHFDEAKSQLERALSYTDNDKTNVNDEKRGITSNWLAYVAFNQRDAKALLKYSEEAIDTFESPNHHTYRGMALLWLGRNDEAREEFTSSKREFVKEMNTDDYELWNKARHLIMATHGLYVLGEEKSSRDGFVNLYLESHSVTQSDVKNILLNNPPVN